VKKGDYLERSLEALVKLLEKATPESQPSQATLETFQRLLALKSAPDIASTKGILKRLDEIEKRVNYLTPGPGIPRRGDPETVEDLRRFVKGVR